MNRLRDEALIINMMRKSRDISKYMNKYINKYILRIAGLGVLLLLSGCAEQEQADIETVAGKDNKKDIISEMESESTVVAEKTTGLAYETAADGQIDFAVIQAENPEIFAWLYIRERILISCFTEPGIG